MHNTQCLSIGEGVISNEYRAIYLIKYRSHKGRINVTIKKNFYSSFNFENETEFIMPGYMNKSSSKCEVCQKRVLKRYRRTITVENAQKIADHFGKTVRYGNKQFICSNCRTHISKGCLKDHKSSTHKNQNVNITIKRVAKNWKRCFLCKRRASEKCRIKIFIGILKISKFNKHY